MKALLRPVRERFLTAAACTIRNSLDIPKLFRQNCEKRLLASPCLSVRPPAWYNLAPTGQISIKFYTMKYLLVSRANNGYAHAPQCCYITGISGSSPDMYRRFRFKPWTGSTYIDSVGCKWLNKETRKRCECHYGIEKLEPGQNINCLVGRSVELGVSVWNTWRC